MEKKLKDKLKAAAENGRVSCALARKIAEEFGVSYGEVGRAADELHIKIIACELGCF